MPKERDTDLDTRRLRSHLRDRPRARTRRPPISDHLLPEELRLAQQLGLTPIEYRDHTRHPR